MMDSRFALTRIVQAQPVEPLPNVFEDINKQEAPEEKTSGIVDNPPRLKDMYEASSLERPEGAEVTEREGDMRAPLGKDAGAAEATGSNADAAGWRGGEPVNVVLSLLNLIKLIF